MMNVTRRAFLTGLAGIIGAAGLPNLAFRVAPAPAEAAVWPYKIIEGTRIVGKPGGYSKKPFYHVMRLVDGEWRSFFGTEHKDAAEMWLKFGLSSSQTTVPDGDLRDTLTNAWERLEADG